VISTLAVDGWAVTFGTVRKAPPCYTKCNSPPIWAVTPTHPNVTAHPASVLTSYHLM